MLDITSLTGIQIGELVNSKQISAVDVIKAFIHKIDSENYRTNAFVYLNFEEALREAKQLDLRLNNGEVVGPLAGVPIGLKDFLPTKKGWPATHGGVDCLRTIDDSDSPFYAAAHKLGAIAIGKTNAPAFGFRGTTDNKLFGPTSTPYNIEYNAGGSSGGSAAAVGGHLVPIAEGGDAGGSIRIPSAWCGCFGFKPSAGIVPNICRPDAWTATHPYCCGGPITRSIEDSAVILSEMIKYDARDPISVPLKIEDISSFLKTNNQLKIGYTYDFNLFPIPHPEIIDSVNKTVDMLRSQGHECTKANFKFKYSLEEIEEAWLRGICIDTAIDTELWKQNNVIDLYARADELPKEFVEWNKKAFKSTMLDYRKFHEIRTDMLDAHIDVFEDVDIIIAPVTGCLPVKNADNRDTQGPKEISGIPINPLIGFGYTYLENMIGTPAASYPIAISSENNLPIGIQIIGRRYKDEEVFQICTELQQLRSIKTQDEYLPY